MGAATVGVVVVVVGWELGCGGGEKEEGLIVGLFVFGPLVVVGSIVVVGRPPIVVGAFVGSKVITLLLLVTVLLLVLGLPLLLPPSSPSLLSIPFSLRPV